MMETLSVSISGPAFSFLLYENTKCTFVQEGFLLGDIIEKETKTITDNDQQQIHISRIIKINSVVPCPQVNYFYDGIGRVDTQKIKNFLGNCTAKVVAWYKYRSSSSFNFTFRERLVHTQLANFSDIPAEYFTCCMLISESSDNGSTHSFTQNFVRFHNSGMEQLPLHIVNLSDPNNTYKSPEKVSPTFSSILEGLNINHKKSQGLTVITKIQNALQKHTNDIVKELSEAEKQLFDLENEVKELTEAFKNKHLTQHALDQENQLNDVIMTETNSSDTINSLNGAIPKKSRRGKGKTTPARERRGGSNSPSKKNNLEVTHEIPTRSRKRNS